MAQIFISYSRTDAEVVDRIHRKLSAAGFGIWLDREDIQGGDLWRRQIVEAISTCSAFVIVLSPNSVQSNNVRKELDIAEGKSRKIYPVMVSKINIPAEMEYQLAGVQIIDLATNLEAGLNRLIESLRGKELRTARPLSEPVRPVQPFQAPATGTIRLVRRNAIGYSGGEGGQYSIWVDDQNVGKLAYSKEINLVVPPGAHQIYVKWTVFKSNVLQFDMDNFQLVKLVCGEKQGLLGGSLFIKFMD